MFMYIYIYMGPARILHMVCEMERSLRNLTTATHVYIPHAYTYNGFLGSGFEISELGEVYIQSTYIPPTAYP